MHVAIVSSIITVLGAGFLGLLYMQFQGLHKAMEKGFATHSEHTERLFATHSEHTERLFATHSEHTERLFATHSEQTERLFAGQREQLGQLFAVVMNHGDILKAHGERLARIETKLELLLPDPPASAADQPEPTNPSKPAEAA